MKNQHANPLSRGTIRGGALLDERAEVLLDSLESLKENRSVSNMERKKAKRRRNSKFRMKISSAESDSII